MTTVAMAGGLMPPQSSDTGINQPDRAPADGCLTRACSEALRALLYSLASPDACGQR